MAFKLFDVLAKKHINVDVIIQSIGREGTKDISFTVNDTDLEEAVAELEKHKSRLGYQELRTETRVAKLSIVGSGMMSNPGVAARMFECLYSQNVNINMISTSEIRITVLVNEGDARARHECSTRCFWTGRLETVREKQSAAAEK